MTKTPISILLCAALAAPLFAHGGSYRGPGDVVPPHPGGNTPGTPGPTGPTTPSAPSPTTPLPAAPSPTTPPGGPRTPVGGPVGPANPLRGPTTGGSDVGPDLTRWQFWWEFNKDPYLNLKEAVHSGIVTTGSDVFIIGGSYRENAEPMAPSQSQIVEEVVPALARALDGAQSRDIVSSCLVALAKAGKDNAGKGVDLREIFKKHLASGDQEIRETAALAMGISWRESCVDDLCALIEDSATGRTLVARGEVDDRTRSFATYALGLVAHESKSLEVKAKALAVFKGQLEDERLRNRNNKVAAINGIRLLKLDPAASDEPTQRLLGDAVDTLWRYYDRKAGKGETVIVAHVPTALATLLGHGKTPAHERCKATFTRDLDAAGTLDRQFEITQSCAVALGLLLDSSKEDVKHVDCLLRCLGTGKDHMTKHFALMALAEIGGDRCRSALLEHFAKGNKAIVKPWAALAIGVLGFRARQAAGQNATVDIEAGRELHAAFKDISTPETRQALAIALGLLQYTDAADDLRDAFIRGRSKDEYAGYLAIGLALMNDRKSLDAIHEVAASSVRRPELLKQAAVALGKMRDKSVTELLGTMLTDGTDLNVSKLSAVATAYGFIGDRRTIKPLTGLLFDSKLTALARAFAAAALGGVVDKELLPWNSKIACDLNYRAAVETLTNESSGVLDIL